MGMSVVLLAVGAAVAYAVAANLKHISAHQVPDAGAFTGHAVVRFVRATVTHRLFLLSIVVDLAGAALQILALRRGALAVVQPLLVSGLVVALIVRAWSGGRVRRVEIGWGVVLVAALSGFLALANVSQNGSGAVDIRPAAVMALAGVVLAAGCVVVARRRRGRTGPAAALGLAVGVIDASTAALLKSLTSVAAGGFSALTSSWQTYVLVLLVPAAMVLNQMAFQAGPLTSSLPVISSVDPLVSVAIGVLVFDETMRHGAPAVFGLSLLLVVLVAAVAVLARSAAPVQASSVAV